MPSITWFDIPADDPSRAKRFYTQIFGWTIDPFPVPYKREFWMVATGSDGVSGGDLFRRESPGQQIMVYIDVPSLDEYIKKVKDNGGDVVVKRTALPGRGYFCICTDTEKNRFGLWESDSTAG
jgi:uncharacterized protein